MPGKVAYNRLESDDGTLFEYQLAEHLRMTVHDMRKMPHSEFIGWNAYLMRKEQLAQIRKG